MELLINQQSQYSQQQLQTIDLIIHKNMDLHLQQLLQSRLTSLLQQEILMHDAPSTVCSQLSLESNVCNMVNRMSQMWNAKQVNFQQTISRQKEDISDKYANIIEKETLIAALESTIQQKDESIIELTKQKQRHYSALMILRQQFNEQKANNMQERLTKQAHIRQISSQLQIQTLENNQKASKISEISQQNNRLREQLRSLSEELIILQQLLVEDSQRLKLNLITSNILVNQISQTHAEGLKQLEKYMLIHQQQMQIVKTLNKVYTLVKLDQSQMQQIKDWHNQACLIDKQPSLFASISDFTSSISRIVTQYQKSIAEVQQKDNLIDQLHKDAKGLSYELAISLQQSKRVRDSMQNVSQMLRQQQKSNYELRQQMMNMKSNLQIMVKTQGDEQDCNYNIVQQLIEKNNDLTSQLTLKKMEIQLNLQTIQDQNHLIDQSNHQIEALTAQNQALHQRLTQLDHTFQEKMLKDQKLSLQIKGLNQKIDYLSKRQPQKVSPKQLQDMQVQTEQQTIESRIKKQIHRQNIPKQMQKSHSLLSQRQQNKQNINKTSLSSSEKQNYKEKIMTLNEIINFMINYSKGLWNGEIRRGSWFMNQASKHGQQYQERLMHPSNLNPKLKNSMFIDTLCRQDSNCNKLIKQFQAIIDFYLNRFHKLNSIMQQSPFILQNKLEKTINKC